MSTPTFSYVNREGAWLDFETRDLDIVDGSLRLAGLPAVSGSLPAGISTLGAPAGPSGIAVAPNGTVYCAVPDDGGVVRVDGCDAGEALIQHITATGVAVHPRRGALIVADAARHRVQLFALDSLQLLDVWSHFDTPSAVAVDADGRVFVADRGNGRVQQFTSGGQPVSGFWEVLGAHIEFDDPVAVAANARAIFVLDRADKTIVAVGFDGTPLGAEALTVDDDPIALVATDDALYLGTNGPNGGRVWRLRLDGTVVGAARGYDGPVAGLALGRHGALLVHPGWAHAPNSLTLDGACVRRGLAWGGPFGAFTVDPKRWHQLRATMTALPPHAHAQFFVHTSDNAGAPPQVDAGGETPFAAPTWSAGPLDGAECLITRDDAVVAWVGLLLTSEGEHTPAVDQIRLDFDHPTYLEHLPAIYRDDEDPHAFLQRFLALVESLFCDVEGEINGLTRLLDPAAAPLPFLVQLARWLALDIAPRWDDDQRRDAVADAYAEAADRGTVRGLRAAVRRATAVDAIVEEPINQAAWWALADSESSPDAERETSILGVTTMLVASEPQGAVVGSTAVVDHSHLITNDEYGVPLFDGLAHRFVVRVYEGATHTEQQLRDVHAVLDRERPAHTEYALCRVEPGVTIGVQSRIGVDTVIGGNALPTPLGEDAMLGEPVLGGQPPGRIGPASPIGVTTLLGSAALGS